MLRKNLVSTSMTYLRVSVVALMILQLSLGGLLAVPLQARDTDEHFTRTPIKHVIVLIGENRTFDHLFATYVPKSDDSVSNLLSKGIIHSDGTPGPHFKKAAQFQATRPFKTEYYISLNKNEKTPYDILPEPTLNFSPSPATGEPPPFPAADLPLLGRHRAVARDRRPALAHHWGIRGRANCGASRLRFANTELQRSAQRAVPARGR